MKKQFVRVAICSAFVGSVCAGQAEYRVTPKEAVQQLGEKSKSVWQRFVAVLKNATSSGVQASTHSPAQVTTALQHAASIAAAIQSSQGELLQAVVAEGSESVVVDHNAQVHSSTTQLAQSGTDQVDLVENVPEAEKGVLDSGIAYEVLSPAREKRKAVAGNVVTVHYDMRVHGSDTIFESSYDRNEPLSFVFGIERVIKGFDLVVAHMAVGAKYRVVIPAELAFGATRVGSVPANSILECVIELVSVE